MKLGVKLPRMSGVKNLGSKLVRVAESPITQVGLMAGQALIPEPKPKEQEPKQAGVEDIASKGMRGMGLYYTASGAMDVGRKIKGHLMGPKKPKEPKQAAMKLAFMGAPQMGGVGAGAGSVPSPNPVPATTPSTVSPTFGVFAQPFGQGPADPMARGAVMPQAGTAMTANQVAQGAGQAGSKKAPTSASATAGNQTMLSTKKSSFELPLTKTAQHIRPRYTLREHAGSYLHDLAGATDRELRGYMYHAPVRDVSAIRGTNLQVDDPLA